MEAQKEQVLLEQHFFPEKLLPISLNKRLWVWPVRSLPQTATWQGQWAVAEVWLSLKEREVVPGQEEASA